MTCQEMLTAVCPRTVDLELAQGVELNPDLELDLSSWDDAGKDQAVELVLGSSIPEITRGATCALENLFRSALATSPEGVCLEVFSGAGMVASQWVAKGPVSFFPAASFNLLFRSHQD